MADEEGFEDICQYLRDAKPVDVSQVCCVLRVLCCVCCSCVLCCCVAAVSVCCVVVRCTAAHVLLMCCSRAAHVLQALSGGEKSLEEWIEYYMQDGNMSREEATDLAEMEVM